MDATLLRSAQSSFNSGITIEDEQNDFVSLEGKEEATGEKNNPKAYEFPYLDVKSVSIGSDDTFLYFKVNYRGQIPAKAEKIGDDTIQGNNMKLHITDKVGKEQAILIVNYSWIPFNLSAFETYYFYEPTGIEFPEDKRYVHQDRDSKIYGGPGTDYLMGAFPLKKLGLSKGQTIYMNLFGEAKSDKYVHASIDTLGGHGKMPGLITWVIGSNTYIIDNNFFN